MTAQTATPLPDTRNRLSDDGELVTLPGVAAPARRVRVPLDDRAYDILVGDGLLPVTGRLIRETMGVRRAAVVTDETVAGHHLAVLSRALDDAGIAHGTIILPPGEGTKRFGSLETLLDGLLASGIERGQPVIALGGGVVGDLAGFAAAVLRRGTRFVQVPTTLLAQVDSSVGGKTGINTSHGKNLVGASHQPGRVVADTGLLSTLPRRELLAGYAEVVKYGAIDDAPFFDWLERRGAEVIAGAGSARDQAVARSCAAKARIVAADETETGQRALLNLGHTFGHAFEAMAGYDGRSPPSACRCGAACARWPIWSG
jgi:3-dehydroquinate synthetase